MPVPKSAAPSPVLATVPRAVPAAPVKTAVVNPDARLLRMAPQSGHLVRTEFDVIRVSVDDPRVCSAIQFASREVSLVGRHDGTTEVKLWTAQLAEPMVYRVQVGRDREASVSRTDGYDKLRVLLQDMYPEGGLDIRLEKGSLIVEGQAKSREEAIQILSLIRSLHTVPVIDRLEVVRVSRTR